MLFLLFAVMMLLWDTLVGAMSWFLEGYSHLQRVLVDRLKEELLALGV